MRRVPQTSAKPAPAHTHSGAVVCTVAHYYTPGGVDINGRGVAVDAEAVCPLDEPALACIEAAR